MYSIGYIKEHKHQFSVCMKCSTINYFTHRECSNCGSNQLIHTDKAVKQQVQTLQKKMKSYDNIKVTSGFDLECRLCGKTLASTNQAFINKTGQLRSYQRELWIEHRYDCQTVKERAYQKQKVAKAWGDDLTFEQALIAAVWEF